MRCCAALAQEVVGCGPRAMLARNWGLLQLDLALIDRKVALCMLCWPCCHMNMHHACAATWCLAGIRAGQCGRYMDGREGRPGLVAHRTVAARFCWPASVCASPFSRPNVALSFRLLPLPWASQVHYMELKGDWGAHRGGYLDWAALCPKRFCAALRCAALRCRQRLGLAAAEQRKHAVGPQACSALLIVYWACTHGLRARAMTEQAEHC